MLTKEASLKITYEGKDITADVSAYLTQFTYTDKVVGESDEIKIEVEDSRALWSGAWYPEKGAKMTASFGYAGRMVNAGTFEVQEIELVGPPDVVSFSGLAAGTKKATRTKNSWAHEDKTLRQIAGVIASTHGFTIGGEIEDIKIARCTQYRETDLSFLARISADYGHAFSLRDSALIFTSLYDLEDAEPVETIDKNDSGVGRYNFKDNTSKTYKSARTKHHKPLSKTAVEANEELGTLPDGLGGADSSDTLEVRERAEDEIQAKSKAKAGLHKANKKGVTGSLTCDGNPYLVAGNNVTLTGWGKFSGIYHIEKSTHTIDKAGGYVTEIEVSRIKTIPESMHVPRQVVTDGVVVFAGK